MWVLIGSIWLCGFLFFISLFKAASRGEHGDDNY